MAEGGGSELVPKESQKAFTYPNLLIFRASREQLPVGTEAYAADVQVAALGVDALVDQRAEVSFPC